MTTRNDHEVSAPSRKNEEKKQPGFLDQPRAGGKSVWEWLNLLATLAVPLVLGLATLFLSMQQTNLANLQHQADQRQAQDQQQAAILQTYIDNIQDLILNHNLLKAQLDESVAVLARARTVTALQGLDPHRKSTLLQFLYQSRLIGYRDPGGGKIINRVINLDGADLSGALLGAPYLAPSGLCNNVACFESHLSGVDLEGVDLSGANLSNADLSGADLSDGDLSRANLTHTNLSGADLFRAKLFSAHLVGANLSGAWLEESDLEKTGVTQPQLDQADSCKAAFLQGTGLTCHHQ